MALRAKTFLTVSVLALVWNGPALADPATDAKIAALEAQLAQLQAQITELKVATKAASTPAVPPTTAIPCSFANDQSFGSMARG